MKNHLILKMEVHPLEGETINGWGLPLLIQGWQERRLGKAGKARRGRGRKPGQAKPTRRNRIRMWAADDYAQSAKDRDKKYPFAPYWIVVPGDPERGEAPFELMLSIRDFGTLAWDGRPNGPWQTWQANPKPEVVYV